MSSINLTVYLPNGKRELVTFDTSITTGQVFEELCAKHSYDREECYLRHSDVVLDGAESLSSSSFTNNSVIVLAKYVVVALQIENERFTGLYPPEVNLWNIVTNLCQLEGFDPSFGTPSVLYMRKEVSGVEELLKTSLRDLGVTYGRVLIRLFLKDGPDCDKGYTFLLEKARNEATKRSEEKKSKESLKQEVTTPEPVTEDHDNSTLGDDLEMAKSRAEKVDVHKALVFRLPDELTESVEVDDTFFDLTLEEAKKLYTELQRKRAELENKPLVTGTLKEQEKTERLSQILHKHKTAVIRVQFPDRTVLQGAFAPLESVQTVLDFIKPFIRYSNAKYYIFTSPPKVVLAPEKKLMDVGCVPCAKVYFGFREPAPKVTDNKYLKDDVLSTCTTLAEANAVAAHARKSLVEPEPSEQAGGTSGGTKGPGRPPQGKGPGGASHGQPRQSLGEKANKVPKWFKPS